MVLGEVKASRPQVTFPNHFQSQALNSNCLVSKPVLFQFGSLLPKAMMRFLGLEVCVRSHLEIHFSRFQARA